MPNVDNNARKVPIIHYAIGTPASGIPARGYESIAAASPYDAARSFAARRDWEGATTVTLLVATITDGVASAEAVKVAVRLTLTAKRSGDGWTVRDAEGGVWHPDAEAVGEIQAAGNPEAVALRICDTEPMRGAWAD